MHLNIMNIKKIGITKIYYDSTLQHNHLSKNNDDHILVYNVNIYYNVLYDKVV